MPVTRLKLRIRLASSAKPNYSQMDLSGADDASNAWPTWRSLTSRSHSAALMLVLRLYRGLDPASFAHWDVHSRSLAARVPSLVLWGDRDPYIPAQFAERFGAGRVLHFVECGHWPQLEMADRVAHELIAFFCAAGHGAPARHSGIVAVRTDG